MRLIIRNAQIVNEGRIVIKDVLINKNRIEKIDDSIAIHKELVCNEINAEGLYLLPGFIDDQVHFREPGLTHKADLFTESIAAVAGGITSFMDMPNTLPNTLTNELLEQKYALAAEKSLANYSFFMGLTKDNWEETLKTDTENVCGVTDDGLYFSKEDGIIANYPEYIEKIFANSNTLIALHSENDAIIKKNTETLQLQFNSDIPFEYHPIIRNEEACYSTTKELIDIAKKYGNRLHLFHISTLAETELFDCKTPLHKKRITAEACVHHLWFSDQDYKKLGAKIKWNPAIKSEMNQKGLFDALHSGKLDIIATDHAPHTIEEKTGTYFQAMSGGPLVQHALPALLEMYHQNKLTLEMIVEKTAHNVAEIYKLKERGYIREGYYADLVLVDLNQSWKVTKENILYKCKWSPFEEQIFQSKIMTTIVNGNIVYTNRVFDYTPKGMRLQFSKIR
jgi:dihydroorotase